MVAWNRRWKPGVTTDTGMHLGVGGDGNVLKIDCGDAHTTL